MQATKHIINVFIALVAIAFFMPTAYAEGSIPTNGWFNCYSHPSSANPSGQTRQTAEAACQQRGFGLGSLTTDHTNINNCGSIGNPLVYKCTPYYEDVYDVVAVLDKQTACPANSTYNEATNRCDCAATYNPSSDNTSCIGTSPQETCEAQNKFWNSSNNSCEDVPSCEAPDLIYNEQTNECDDYNVCVDIPDSSTELSVIITNDASNPPVVDPYDHEYVNFNACQYHIRPENIPTTTEELNCYTITGDTHPKTGYCSFDYHPTHQIASSGDNAELKSVHDVFNEACTGGAEKNEFGLCDATVNCDDGDNGTEWHNYNTNKCEPKVQCNADQVYFSNEIVQGCQNNSCPSGQFRPDLNSPCQQGASCGTGEIAHRDTCLNQSCPAGQYRETEANDCIPIPDSNKVFATCSEPALPAPSCWTGAKPHLKAGTNKCVTPIAYYNPDYDAVCVSQYSPAIVQSHVDNYSNFCNPDGTGSQWFCGKLDIYQQGYRDPYGYSKSNTNIVTRTDMQSPVCGANTTLQSDGSCLPDVCINDPENESCPNNSDSNGNGENGSGGLAECEEGQDCGFNGPDLEQELTDIKSDYANKLGEIKDDFANLIEPIQTNPNAQAPTVGFDGSTFSAHENLEQGGINWTPISNWVMLISSVLAIGVLLVGFK